MTIDDRLLPAPNSSQGATTAAPSVVSPLKLVITSLPSSDSFACVVRIASANRHFRLARARAADEAARVAEKPTTEKALLEGMRESDIEQAAIDGALQAAENEGWTSEGAARHLARPRSLPVSRR